MPPPAPVFDRTLEGDNSGDVPMVDVPGERMVINESMEIDGEDEDEADDMSDMDG